MGEKSYEEVFIKWMENERSIADLAKIYYDIRVCLDDALEYTSHLIEDCYRAGN